MDKKQIVSLLCFASMSSVAIAESENSGQPVDNIKGECQFVFKEGKLVINTCNVQLKVDSSPSCSAPEKMSSSEAAKSLPNPAASEDSTSSNETESTPAPAPRKSPAPAAAKEPAPEEPVAETLDLDALEGEDPTKETIPQPPPVRARAVAATGRPAESALYDKYKQQLPPKAPAPAPAAPEDENPDQQNAEATAERVANDVSARLKDVIQQEVTEELVAPTKPAPRSASSRQAPRVAPRNP